MLKVENIDVYYSSSIHALHGVSFYVNEGEIVSLIGANGAGKSTTLKSISGLLHPTNGKIFFEDNDITHLDANIIVQKGIAQVPEGRRVFSKMSVEENLEIGAYSSKNTNINQAKEEVFSRFPRLLERRKQLAGTLSGGEQQMLAIGRALMSKPKILMLDEPSMGLAPILVTQIFDIIKELHSSGTTILLVEQNAKMALKISDRAYVLETGKIVNQGTGIELSNSDAIKKAYLGG